MDTVTLGAAPLTLEALEAVARRGARLAVHPGAMARVQQSRALVERWVAEARPVYGITTGFGALCEVVIPPGDTRTLQETGLDRLS